MPSPVEQALIRIAVARSSGATMLDLGDLPLDELPAELGQLTTLRILSLGRLVFRREGGAIQREYESHRPIQTFPNIDVLASLRHLCVLDLSWCAGTHDFSPLAGLRQIRWLNLASSGIRDLSPIGELPRLRSLFLEGCLEFRELAPLSQLQRLEKLSMYGCSPIHELRSIAALSKLRNLDLSWNRLHADLAELAPLQRLERLSLAGAKGFVDPGPLGTLRSLRWLDLGVTDVTDIRDLASLTQLRFLGLGSTPIEAIPAIRELRQLRRVFLGGCELLRDIAPLAELPHLRRLGMRDCHLLSEFAPLRPLLPQLRYLNLHGCRFHDMPNELCGEHPHTNVIDRVRAHYRDLEFGVTDDAELKVFVLGNGGVGKTQLCRRLRRQPYDPAIPTTHGIQLGHVDLTVPETRQRVRLNLWDFGGQDVYHGSHTLFLQGQAIFILLWHPEREGGDYFEGSVALKHHPLAYWFDYVRGLGGSDAPVLIVQSQCEESADRRPLPAEFPDDLRWVRRLEFSARTGWGMEELQVTLKQAVREVLARTPIRAIGQGRWEVRETLRKMLASDRRRTPENRQHRIMSRETFQQLCDANGKISDAGALLHFLHQTGVLFHRQGLFHDLIVLDQGWALDAIYALFHRGKTLPWLQRDGRFTRKELGHWVWQSHSETEQELFLSMMENCGICFRVRPMADGEPRYIAPELLPTWGDVQEQLLGRLRDDPPHVAAEVRYRFLHDGILRSYLSRIGRHTRDVAIYWKFGCWFYERNSRSQVLIESQCGSDAMHPGAGIVTLKAWGERPRELLEPLLRLLTDIAVGQPPEVTITGPAPAPPSSAARPTFELAPERPASLPDEGQPIFISYAWGDDHTTTGQRRGAFVERLCQRLVSEGYHVVRDCTAMHTGDLISGFMLRIGRASRVVVVLSEKYLRSPYCMTELHHIYAHACGEEKEFLQRIVPVVLENGLVEDWRSRMAWAKHWERELQEMEVNLRYLGEADLRGYRLIKRWHADVATMLGYIADQLSPRVIHDHELDGGVSAVVSLLASSS